MFSVSVFYPTFYLSFTFKARRASRCAALGLHSRLAARTIAPRPAYEPPFGSTAFPRASAFSYSSENSTTPMKGRSLYFWS